MAEWSGQDWLEHLEKQPPRRILSDRPKADATRFGFGPMAATLVGLISERENQTPFTIGIHGPWGSGKTTLLETTQAILQGLYDTIPGGRITIHQVGQSILSWVTHCRHAQSYRLRCAILSQVSFW